MKKVEELEELEEDSEGELEGDMYNAWTEPGYEMRGDEMDVMVNAANQMARTLRRPTFGVSWFRVRDLFSRDSVVFNSQDVFDDPAKQQTLFGGSFVQKKVMSTVLLCSMLQC